MDHLIREEKFVVVDLLLSSSDDDDDFDFWGLYQIVNNNAFISNGLDNHPITGK